MQRIIPAIIPKSAAHLADTLTHLSFAHSIQIDVVDGVFASPASWPYEPYGSVSDISAALTPYAAEIDLMVEDGIAAARAWSEIGIQRFVFHVEAVDDISHIKAFKDEHRSTIGLSIANDTPIEALTAYIENCDFVQLMGITKIGAQGQTFDERVLFRIQQLRTEYPNLIISIDGSVNADTLPRLLAAGADRFVAGSAILNAENPAHSYAALTALAES